MARPPKPTLNALLKQLKDVPDTVQALEYDPVTGACKVTFWGQVNTESGPAKVQTSPGPGPGPAPDKEPDVNALDLVLVPPDGVDTAPVIEPDPEAAEAN